MEPNPAFYKKQIRDLAYYQNGISAGNKFVLAEAITLIENNKEEKKSISENLLTWAYENNEVNSFRIAITGSPGAGKSTFIDYLGSSLAQKGYRIAVLTIDPSSSTTKVSILGDKTRMEKLSGLESVFIRPSPSGNILGGVGPNTKEAILLCEAAGYDRIIIETVGVGQSETEVSDLSDVNILILQPGAGDDLQGIKRGIVESADLAVVNKNDGHLSKAANETARFYKQSFVMFHHSIVDWKVPVLLVSSIENTGISSVLESLDMYKKIVQSKGIFTHRRDEQEKIWFQKQVPVLLLEMILSRFTFKNHFEEITENIKNKKSNAVLALREIRKLFQEILPPH
ncbi:MAG: methylmalonyl Co-A mutase-associated GTPase MeaB [Saprospiraceae bacterium]|nr:methylmalonyl Co-A mutase-associated GTPase MeaB [Saprospiraceae bacterium]